MTSIFRKVYIGHLAASVSVLAVMSLIFLFAIRSSISHWNRDENTEIEKMLLPRISKVYRLKGELDSKALESSLLPYMTDSMYVYIFDLNKRPVLLMYKGRRVTTDAVEAQVGNISTFLSLNTPAQIKDNSRIVGYLSVNSADFLTYRANRQFISSMRNAILAGAITAIVIALAISAFISSVFSKQTSSLVDEITALGNGSRSVSFTHLDTTEFDRIATSEEKLQDQLLKEESLRRQWMQDVSHDLRTPVTAVKVQLEAMDDGILPATEERLSSLLGELHHIEKLVNNLHDLSKYESPEMKITPVTIYPQAFITDTKERFELLASQKNIAFACTSTFYEPFTADEFLLQRCVSNIVQNAIQYTAAGGSIRVTMTCGDPGSTTHQTITIEVENTGELSREDLVHVFDRLYRGDKSRTNGGSGLGLSIAKAIMTLHAGTITVSNKDGMVCFAITFPFRRTAEPQT
ncbi:MAG TPA: sensor histidine kinase [Treponema sp.]|nr:sensor histidine kinase [Treponema sp.]